MNVLLILEDSRNDGFIARPLMKRLFQQLGRPHTTIEECRDPALHGVSQALDEKTIFRALDAYRYFTHVFPLLVDRDGDAGREERLRQLEVAAQNRLPKDRTFLAACAWQEIEVWALAGQKSLPAPLRELRSEPHAKERFFEPFAASRGLLDEPGKGRKTVGQEAAKASSYKQIVARCPEFKRLEQRLKTWLST